MTALYLRQARSTAEELEKQVLCKIKRRKGRRGSKVDMGVGGCVGARAGQHSVCVALCGQAEGAAGGRGAQLPERREHEEGGRRSGCIRGRAKKHETAASRLT